MCSSAHHIGHLHARHTQLHLKGPKDQRASRARFPDGDYCCHSRVSTRAPNTLTRVLDFSEWFIKTENKQLGHVEICSKLGGHNRKLISGRKCLVSPVAW